MAEGFLTLRAPRPAGLAAWPSKCKGSGVFPNLSAAVQASPAPPVATAAAAAAAATGVFEDIGAFLAIFEAALPGVGSEPAGKDERDPEGNADEAKLVLALPAQFLQPVPIDAPLPLPAIPALPSFAAPIASGDANVTPPAGPEQTVPLAVPAESPAAFSALLAPAPPPAPRTTVPVERLPEAPQPELAFAVRMQAEPGVPEPQPVPAASHTTEAQPQAASATPKIQAPVQQIQGPAPATKQAQPDAAEGPPSAGAPAGPSNPPPAAAERSGDRPSPEGERREGRPSPARATFNPTAHTVAPAQEFGPASTRVEAPQRPAAPHRIAEPVEPAVTRTPREIAFQLSGSGDNHRVDVRVSERAGEIRVSVRTPDATLTRDMRQNLGELSNRLEQTGYRAETWQPARAESQSGFDRRESAGGEPPPQRGSQGQSSPDRQQHQGSGKRPAWVEEFEESLAMNQRKRSTP